MFEELDSSRIKPFHLRTVIVSGMGVFSDSYNLYAISLVFYPLLLALKLPTSEYNTLNLGLLLASSYLGAAAGAFLFGPIADKIGRKPMYGIDLSLIFIGAGLQFFASSYLILMLTRIVLGFGIGGDYVMSPVIMAENSNTKDRGKLMATAFSIMYLLGALLAAFVDQLATVLLPQSISWKVVLSFGALPALFVIYYRRKIPETYRFISRVKGESPNMANGTSVNTSTATSASAHASSLRDTTPYLMRLKKSLPVVISGGVLWFLYDAYSSTFTVYGPITIASNLGLSAIQFTYAAVFLAGLPGTLLALYLIDRVGRRRLVAAGYAGVFVALLLYALLLLYPSMFGIPPSETAMGRLMGTAALLGFAFYLVNYLFSGMGPATVIGGTIIMPELVPTKVRASGQAINVSIDRLLAALWVTSFPVLLGSLGLGSLVLIFALIAVASSVIMYVLIPETKGRTLEEISKEAIEPGLGN